MISAVLQFMSSFVSTSHAVSQVASQVGTLAFRPFLDPLVSGDMWLVLMLPLILAIALVYKTIKVDDNRVLFKQTFYLWMQIVLFMAAAATGLWILSAIV